MLGEDDDIVAALPQRRQNERQAGQALIEILAEAAFQDGGPEVDIARADDPDVDPLAPRAAEPAYGSLLDHIEEFGLQRRGQ